MLSGLSAALGFGRGAEQEAEAAAAAAEAAPTSTSTTQGGQQQQPTPSCAAVKRDSSHGSGLSSEATTPLDGPGGSGERFGEGLLPAAAATTPLPPPRLVFQPASDSAAAGGGGGGGGGGVEAMDVAPGATEWGDYARPLSRVGSSCASSNGGAVSGGGSSGQPPPPQQAVRELAEALLLGEVPGSAPAPYATLAQRQQQQPQQPQQLQRWAVAGGQGEQQQQRGGVGEEGWGDEAAAAEEKAGGGVKRAMEDMGGAVMAEDGVVGGMGKRDAAAGAPTTGGPDGAAAGGGGGLARRLPLRRSYSYSNLYDRSTSLDRPSVNQCIRAIGFLLEHMMREDSYRDRSSHYDFSRPRRRRHRRRQQGSQGQGQGQGSQSGAGGVPSTYKRGRGEAGARTGRAPGRRRRGGSGTGGYYGQEDDAEGATGCCDSTDDEAGPYGAPFAVGREGEGSSWSSSASSVMGGGGGMGGGVMGLDGDEVASEDVADFLHQVYSLCKWTPECNIMALILVIRLFQYNPDMTLHPGNWRRLLLTALMIAQKTWDDRALRNKDFPQIWAAVVGTGATPTPAPHDFPPPEPPLSLEETNEMERAFLTRLDHQLFIAPATYASTYFELCSLVPSSEEALRRQLYRMTELAGANVRVVLRQQQRGALHPDSQTGEGIALHPHDAHYHPHHGGGGALAYNTAEVIYSGEGAGW